jgi:hypothetical protein
LNRRLFGGVDFDSAPGEWNEVITPGSKCIFKFGKALFWNETLRETNKQTIALECQARCSIVSFDENATVSAMKEFRMYADTQTGLLRLARTTEY